MINAKERKKTHPTFTRKSLFDVNELAIGNRYWRCKHQKDGREEREEKQSNACHRRKEDSESGEDK